MFKKLLHLLLLIFLAGGVFAQAPDSTAYYMANEGLMVVNGDTKILFDPLFRNSYGQYLLLPEEIGSGAEPIIVIGAISGG